MFESILDFLESTQGQMHTNKLKYIHISTSLNLPQCLLTCQGQGLLVIMSGYNWQFFFDSSTHWINQYPQLLENPRNSVKNTGSTQTGKIFWSYL